MLTVRTPRRFGALAAALALGLAACAEPAADAPKDAATAATPVTEGAWTLASDRKNPYATSTWMRDCVAVYKPRDTRSAIDG